MHKFEIYKDKKGEFRFRFLAGNGETMFASEGYKVKASATKAIESIKKNAPAAEVDDQTKAAPAAKPSAGKTAAAKPATNAAKAAKPAKAAKAATV
jgi:uncharacterized protein YegP (UPF0339 family)